MAQRLSTEILRAARETLVTAEQGLADLSNAPSRRMSGLRNLVVFGRAVTNVLQNLRSVRPDFDEWYEPVRSDLESSPLMKFFYQLRSEILKKGEAGVSSRLHIKSFSPATDMAKFGKPPKNARRFFMGDSLGGTGWEVEVAPGTMEKYYVDLPLDIGTAGLFFGNAPGVTNPMDPTQGDVVTLCKEYVDTLRRVLQSAEDRFK
jgi:hypothetical protein